MRSKEEIEQLANKYSSLGQAAGLSNREYTLENIAYRRGYEQCQEDMADEIKKLNEIINKHCTCFGRYICDNCIEQD